MDVARSANHILRMALEGRIILLLRPPGYDPELHQQDIGIIEDILAKHKVPSEPFFEEDEEETSESNDEMNSVVTTNKFSTLKTEGE